MEIKDKVVIVTGASSGIGEATARLLAAHGACVALVARTKEKLDALASKLPNSFSVPADVSDARAITRMVEEVKKHYGRIDILVNNAGQGIYGPIEKVSPDALKKIIDLNILGPVRAMQAIIPLMRENGGGVIINVSSMTSTMLIPNLGAYAGTKAALNTISLTAREELEKDKIVVSIIMPGLTDTDFGKNALKFGGVENMESRRREGMPEPDAPDIVAEKIFDIIKSGEAEVRLRG